MLRPYCCTDVCATTSSPSNATCVLSSAAVISASESVLASGSEPGSLTDVGPASACCAARTVESAMNEFTSSEVKLASAPLCPRSSADFSSSNLLLNSFDFSLTSAAGNGAAAGVGRFSINSTTAMSAISTTQRMVLYICLPVAMARILPHECAATVKIPF